MNVAIVVMAATLPGGATVTFDQLLLHEGGNPQLAPPAGPDSAARYFNLAHCACSQRDAAEPGYVEQTFAYRLLLQNATTPVHRPLDLWVGAHCDDAATRAAQCHLVATLPDLSAIPAGGIAPEISVIDLMEPEPGALTCDTRAVASGEWAIADADGDGVYDYFAAQPIATDALAPPLPVDFHVMTGAGSFELSWVPPADLSDVAAYQVLCALADGTPATTSAPPPPRYVTARRLCGEALDVPLVPSALDLGPIDGGGDVELPQSIAQLDPANLCGDTADPNATSLRVTGLPDGKPLVVLFLAIDRAGNAAATYLYPTVTPGATAKSAGGSCAVVQPSLLLVLALYSGLSIGTKRASRPGKRMRSSSARRIGPNTSVAT